MAIVEKRSEISEWFDDFVETLRVHQIQLETHTASGPINKLYQTLQGGNQKEIFGMNKQMTQRYFVEQIILDYLKLLNNNVPKKLAFDFNDSEVLVWAEIEDDDTEAEKSLILNEAKINAQYHEFGFDMNSTIVEVSDGLLIPKHYKVFK